MLKSTKITWTQVAALESWGGRGWRDKGTKVCVKFQSRCKSAAWRQRIRHLGSTWWGGGGWGLPVSLHSRVDGWGPEGYARTNSCSVIAQFGSDSARPLIYRVQTGRTYKKQTWTPLEIMETMQQISRRYNPYSTSVANIKRKLFHILRLVVFLGKFLWSAFLHRNA